MHHRIGDRFAQGTHRVFRHLLALQPFDTVRCPGIPRNQTEAFLNVADHATGKILAIQNIDLVYSFGQETGHICLREETLHLLGKEEYPDVAKDETSRRRSAASMFIRMSVTRPRGVIRLSRTQALNFSRSKSSG